MRSNPITPEGLGRLKEELQRLKKERLKTSQEIGAAIEMGDLSENFEYHAAKDRQGQMEARVRQLEDLIARAEVIDPKSLDGDRVVFGATVVLADVEEGTERTFQIVGESESDVEHGRISVASPLARRLIGREVGDEVEVRGRSGPRRAEIVEVRFGNG